MAEETLDVGFGGAYDVENITHVKSLDEAKTLPEGTTFIDPQGKKRQVPYRVKDPDEAEALPEGSQFYDPTGTLRQVPKYEGLDFTTQTLYDMSATDTERKKALERGYPGKVKQNPRTQEYYVDDDGKRRRSQGFTGAPGAFAAAQAAPVIGSMLGEAGGAIAAAPSGPGLFLGAAGGGFAGAAAGQVVNDAILSLAGVYDRTKGEEAEQLGAAGSMGAVGSMGGRFVGGAWPIIKHAASRAAPKLVSDFLGADPEALAFAKTIKQKNPNVIIPPSAIFKESPHVVNVAEVLDPAMRQWNPILTSATEHYESEAGGVLDSLGIKRPQGKVSEPTAAVSSEEAGDKVLARMNQDLTSADKRVRDEFENRRTLLERDKNIASANYKQQVAALEAAQAEATKKANAVFKRGLAYVRRSSEKAMEAVGADKNSGNLWWQVGEKIRAYRAAISSRATDMYNLADELSGGITPNVEGLSAVAKDFLEQMPDGFKAKFPSMVQKISDWAGKLKPDGSGWEVEPTTPTWAQLHNLRSVMRANYNHLDLTPDIKDGTFKFFAQKVDEIISDETGDPRLAAAAKQLRATDDFYRDNMGPLRDARIQAVVDGLKAGMPGDPKLLYNAILKEGRTELTEKVKSVVGKNLWSAIAAADKSEMLDQAKTLVPGQIDGRKFAQQILDRDRDGMLELVHGKRTADQLRRKAQNVGLLEGKFDVNIRPGDTMTDAIERADQAAKDIKFLADKDPLGTLQHEMEAINKEEKAALQANAQQRGQEKLGFLYDLKLGASTAADRILDNDDLILAAAAKFGENSPEFNALRQVYAQRILMGTIDPGERLAKTTETVQRLMFPGTTLDQMQTLAKEMTFLLSSRSAGQGTGKSIMATMVQENPWGSHMPIPETGHSAFRKMIGANFIGRAILTKYFAFVTELTQKPWLWEIVQKGLTGPDPAKIAATRQAIQKRIALGGRLGAGLAESQFQTSNQNVVLP